jgi:VWFA-related protein
MQSHGRTISRRGLLSLATLLPAGRLLRAQQQEGTFSTGVKVVNVFATVRNNKGQIVRDLTKDDFALEEDGHAQTIRYFSRESDLPLTLGLLVDTSGSMRHVLDEERNASSTFFDQVLREDKDQAFVIHFDSEVELLQDLTPSRKKLQAALSDLQASAPRQLNRRDSTYPGGSGGGSSGGQGGGQGGGYGRGGGTSLDAVLLASDEVMKKQTGRKALIVLSDGVDNSSRSTLADAIASAQKADTLAYTILIADEQQQNFQSPMGGFGGRGMGRHGGMGRMPQQQNRPDGKKIMERLAKETGGGFFEISKKQPIDKIFEQIQEELRNQYSLGYTSDRTDSGAGYRKIHVTVAQKGLIVQSRDGYYADK